jgi:hypothetical protein
MNSGASTCSEVGVGTTKCLLGLVLHQLHLLGADKDVLEVHRPIFRSAFSECPGGHFEYTLSGAFARGSDDEGSVTEVEDTEDGGNAAMPVASESGMPPIPSSLFPTNTATSSLLGVSNEEPPLSASASVSGPSTPPATLPGHLSLGAPDIKWSRHVWVARRSCWREQPCGIKG